MRGFLAIDPDYVAQWKLEHTLPKRQINIKETMKGFHSHVDNIFIKFDTIILCFKERKTRFELFFNFVIRFIYFIGWTYIKYVSNPCEFWAIITFFGYIKETAKDPFSELPF